MSHNTGYTFLVQRICKRLNDRFYEEFRGGASSDCDSSSIVAEDDDRIGRRVARLDRNRLTGLQVARFDETQKNRILIGDSDNAQLPPGRAREQIFEMALRDGTIRPGNG